MNHNFSELQSEQQSVILNNSLIASHHQIQVL